MPESIAQECCPSVRLCSPAGLTGILTARLVHAAAKAQRLREAGSAEGCKAAVRNGASSAASGARRPPARSRPVSFAGPAGGMMRARLAALLPLLLFLTTGLQSPVLAKTSGIEAARICCGRDCVDLDKDFADAWSRRDQLGGHAQIFPRVRPSLPCSSRPSTNCMYGLTMQDNITALGGFII